MLDIIKDIVDGVYNYFFGSKEEKPVEKKREIPNYPKTPLTKQPDLENDIPEDTVKFIAKFLISSTKKQITLEGAAALIANMWRESFLNPAQLQLRGKPSKPVGPGRGLAQWEDSTISKSGSGRWDEYENVFFPNLKASHSFWKDHTLIDIEPQLAYLVYELINKKRYAPVWREVTSPGSISSKTIMVLKKFEAPKNRNDKEEQNLRVGIAEKVYNMIKNDPKIKELIQPKKGKS